MSQYEIHGSLPDKTCHKIKTGTVQYRERRDWMLHETTNLGRRVVCSIRLLRSRTVLVPSLFRFRTLCAKPPDKAIHPEYQTAAAAAFLLRAITKPTMAMIKPTKPNKTPITAGTTPMINCLFMNSVFDSHSSSEVKPIVACR